MIKNCINLFSLFLLCVSCVPHPKAIIIVEGKEKKVVWPYSSKDKQYYNIDSTGRMSNIMNGYIYTYFRRPKTANDLIVFIERANTATFDMNGEQYEFLKKHKDKIIFMPLDTLTLKYDPENIVYSSADSLTLMCYGKPEFGRNIAIGYSDIRHEEQLKRHITFFDKNGYYIELDSLRGIVNNRLRDINKAHADELKLADNNFHSGKYYERIILEYTPHNLKNLLSGRDIDYGKSVFFTEIYNYLNYTASNNDLSRIIIPSFTDKL